MLEASLSENSQCSIFPTLFFFLRKRVYQRISYPSTFKLFIGNQIINLQVYNQIKITFLLFNLNHYTCSPSREDNLNSHHRSSNEVLFELTNQRVLVPENPDKNSVLAKVSELSRNYLD